MVSCQKTYSCLIRLRKLVPEGLDNVSTELIKKFFRLCRHAYREGHTGKAVEACLKVYKSHRRVQCVDKTYHIIFIVRSQLA